jgi:hypothetical protein
MRVMRQQQPPGGKIFLVDGQGSDGRATPKNAAYGATKAALVQLKVAHVLHRCCLWRAAWPALDGIVELIAAKNKKALLIRQAVRRSHLGMRCDHHGQHGSQLPEGWSARPDDGSERHVVAMQASLAAQGRGSSTSVHLVSPGMVATDLLAASARSWLCKLRIMWLPALLDMSDAGAEPSTALPWPLVPLITIWSMVATRSRAWWRGALRSIPHRKHRARRFGRVCCLHRRSAPRAARFLNVLAEEPRTVAAWFVTAWLLYLLKCHSPVILLCLG